MSTGAVRVRTSSGWRDIALTGPKGDTGPQGPPGNSGGRLAFGAAPSGGVSLSSGVSWAQTSTPQCVINGWWREGTMCWVQFGLSITAQDHARTSFRDLLSFDSGMNADDGIPPSFSESFVGSLPSLPYPTIAAPVNFIALGNGINTSGPAAGWGFISQFQGELMFQQAGSSGAKPSTIYLRRWAGTDLDATVNLGACRILLRFEYPCELP